MIQVVLAEDHLLVRAGIENLLRAADDIEIVGVASDGLEAVAVVEQTHPDVVLMDLSMPNLDGVGATHQIITMLPETRVLVLTSFSDRERVVDAFDAGAIGYLLKDGEPEDLVKAVRAAARGEVPLDPRAARVLLERRGSTRPIDALTERERDVLLLLSEGLANKLIARRLGISEKTVKTHLGHVFQTIGVRDRTQAALWAKRHALGETSP